MSDQTPRPGFGRTVVLAAVVTVVVLVGLGLWWYRPVHRAVPGPASGSLSTTLPGPTTGPSPSSSCSDVGSGQQAGPVGAVDAGAALEPSGAPDPGTEADVPSDGLGDATAPAGPC